MTSLRQAAMHAAEFGGAGLNMGLSLMAPGRHGEAVDAFAEATRSMSKGPQPETEHGSTLKALNRRDEAIAAHQSPIARAPRHAAVNHNLGNAFAAAGRFVEAKAAYCAALAATPDFAEAMVNPADLRLMHGSADGDEEAASPLGDAASLVPAIEVPSKGCALPVRPATNAPLQYGMDGLRRRVR